MRHFEIFLLKVEKKIDPLTKSFKNEARTMFYEGLDNHQKACLTEV